jgi:hypothetical protein
MGPEGFADVSRTPGFSALQDSFHLPPEQPLDHALLAEYVADPRHTKYLENKDYLQYLKMHKVMVGVSGAQQLESLGDSMAQQYLPRFKDAAAWAYVEAGLMNTDLSTVERVGKVTEAERQWSEALGIEAQIQSSEYSAVFDEPDTQYRLALALAYAPLIKSIIIGNVTDTIRHQAMYDTAQFAELVSNEITRYSEVGDRATTNGFIGLAHELNALLALHYLDDPRYIPLPSTARADTGYFHANQTHDLMIIHQHWGQIRKVVPIEIKSRPSQRDRQRYKALLVRGKMHLTIAGVDPRKTSQSFAHHVAGTATLEDTVAIERISTDLREMLRLYQQGVTPEKLAVNSLTSFMESSLLKQAHPEIAAS